MPTTGTLAAVDALGAANYLLSGASIVGSVVAYMIVRSDGSRPIGYCGLLVALIGGTFPGVLIVGPLGAALATLALFAYGLRTKAP